MSALWKYADEIVENLVETVENSVFTVFLVAVYLLYRIYIENARLFPEKPI